MSSARLTPPRPRKGSTLPLDAPETRREAGRPRSVPPPSMPASSAPGGAGAGPPSSQPDFPVGLPVPEGAPEWMRQGRVMAATIEAAISRGAATPQVFAAVQRAWAAWSLGGTRPKQIAHVARLVERAHRALRETARADRGTVEQDCATLLYNGLPSERRKHVHRDDVLEVVRELRDVLGLDDARIRATAKLLGWTESSHSWMSEAIESALREHA